MRLIDVDAFKRQIAGMTIANSYSVNKANALCELIDAQPIAFDLDKVVEQLKDEQELSYADFEITQRNMDYQKMMTGITGVLEEQSKS